MYVTRPLSAYKNFPELISAPPPEGPNSGYLVVLDEEAEPTCCFGLCMDDRIRDMPFPQNKNLTITYTTGSGEHQSTSHNYVFLIPVLNQPLSSNRYYVVERRGKHKGEAYANSKEEDMGTFLCCNYARDVKPKPLDPSDIYHQVEIIRKWSGFSAMSISPDGIPPYFLRRKGWRVRASIPRDYRLDEAPGLNSSLRARLPDFNFPLSYNTSETVVVGKWYCPFMFVKEEMKLKDQMKTSVFYEMTLEQRWEKIFARDNSDSSKGAVLVDAVVEREAVFVAGREAVWDERNVGDGVIWYKSIERVGGEVIGVGLSLEIVERIKWEQERVGWKRGDERQVRVEKTEEFGGTGGWKKLGSYVLVERFVLKRMDGSLVLTYDFKHTHQIRSIWE